MLSKKMAFSLMSLITVFALAFAVSPAMAAGFSVSMKIHPDDDLSSEAGAQADPNKDVRVIITFGQIVQTDDKADTMKFSLKDFEVFAHDKYGQPKDAPGLKDLKAFPPADGTNYMFTVSAPKSGTTRVVLFIDKDKVEAADPGFARGKDDRKSVMAVYEIAYRDDFDHGAPRVYKIERASPNHRLPVLTETANSFQAVITLSEQPKAFTKDHIYVTGGTAGTPIPLITKDATSDLTEYGNMGEIEGVQSLYDADDKDGLHAIINASTLANDGTFVFADANAAVPVSSDLEGKVKTLLEKLADYTTKRTAAHGNDGIADDPFPEYPDITTARTAPTADAIGTSGLGETADLDTDAVKKLLPRTAPGKKIKVSLFDGRSGTTRGSAAEKEIDGDPTKPSPKDYPVKEVYDNALSDYMTLKAAQDAYKAGVAVKDAYDAFYKQMVMENTEIIEEYYAELSDRAKIEELLKAMPATGTDKKLHLYYVVITPDPTKSEVVVKVRPFEDLTLPIPLKYSPPLTDRGYTDGYDVLRVRTSLTAPVVTMTAGIEVVIGKGVVIPKDGYLVVAKSPASSAVRNPGDATKAPANPPRQPFGLTYNLIEGATLPNLESVLTNGATIDVVGPQKLVISEIMWGSDLSLLPSSGSQYIELRNVSGAAITAGEKDYKIVVYPYGATLPAMSSVQDRVGTVGVHGRWSVTGKGQSGKSLAVDVQQQTTFAWASSETIPIVSMQRTADAASATGLAADGTDPMSWGASVAPGLNFDPNREGERAGSPGRAPLAYPVTPTPEPTPKPEPTIPAAMIDDIKITEIMVDTGDGKLPQWIELTNVSGAEKRLDGWSVEISNSVADTDVIARKVSISLSGTLGVGGGTGAGGTMGKSLLLVAWGARSSSNLSGSDRVINVSSDVKGKGRYKLISDMAFMVTLLPPLTSGIIQDADAAGNLGASPAWDIPMSETGRSSLIRYEELADGTSTMGTDENGWVLASKTGLVTGEATWYGSDEDAGTPGHDAGGPLPVELSHFRPARDKATGAVVITWATQSELNNAGFFIKRSNQRDGQFKVVNPTMIPGAGTTSEKQSYTYTDTTAQPNVVYYYQIEDVSLDGQRQTLTRGIRLKGHVGAAGKATVIWGEIKASNE
ncbi:hypothetical protein C6503_13275 [Candidatus Poribacteria bacterium]|nr:MAG: hypothetical protein C6503_13275 [Candidatus Poribacteria bacterium]